MIQSAKNQTAINKLLAHLGGIFLLMAPALYNGFPLVYSDTATYIISGMDWMVPNDRPVFYGIFIRITSIGGSLWGVVFWQAVMVYYVLYHFVRTFSEKLGAAKVWSVVLVLVLSSGLGWYTSQIMPDIFAALSLLIIPVLLFYRPEKLNRIHAILLGAIFVICLLVHFSHLLIAVFTLILLFLFSKKLGLLLRKRTALILLCVVLSVPLSGFVNWCVDGSFSTGRGGHVYLISKLYDSGVLETFLENECAGGQYTLCAYKDSLPENSRRFLWNADSPLYQLGGWEGSQDVFYEVLGGIITHPKYLLMYGYNAAYTSMAQLFQNDVGSGLVSDWYAHPDKPPATAVRDFFPHEYKPYQQSRQNKNLWGQGLDFSTLNVLVNWLLIFSSVLLIYTLSRKSLRSIITPEQHAIVWALIIGVVMNAVVTASLANVYDRLQARVSWLILLAAMLILMTHFKLFYREFREWRNSQK